jgi:small conductance mechanosensitive channel
MEKLFLDLGQWLELNLAEFGLRLLAALAVLVAGFLLARAARSAALAAMGRTPLRRRALLMSFLARVAGTTVMVLAAVVALGELGVDIGPLIAGIGITGFVVGFAFKDSLSNLAAGLLLLFYEPFDVGELVEVGGLKGRVLNMTVAATELRMEDGKLAIMPNSKIWNAPIINHTRSDPPAP